MLANVSSSMIRTLKGNLYDQTIKGNLAIKTAHSFEIVHVHVSGTITIQLWPCVREQINICHTIYYKDLFYK